MSGTWAQRLDAMGGIAARHAPRARWAVPAGCVAVGALWGWTPALVCALLFPAALAQVAWARDRAPTAPATDPRRTLRHALDTACARRHAPGGEQPNAACLMVQIEGLADATAEDGPRAAGDAMDDIHQRLVTALRGADAVIRLGETSFAIVIAAQAPLDIEALMQIAARMQSAVSAPLAIGNGRGRLLASVGLCTADSLPQADAPALIDAAETALIEARTAACGSIRVYAPAMRTRRAARAELLQDAARALENGQIRPWFQPQISTDTGRVTGFEALARWHHPARGVISPAEFLPALDAAGLLERLGEVMIDHALKALAGWDAADLDVPCVGVNLSLADLRNPALADRVAWQIDRFDLTPDRLVVEVLETVVANTPGDAVCRNIAALSGIGCGVDLDDFGTGHASITSLRQLRIDRIKLDRSFVTGVDADREQQKMVTTILAMCEHLELASLAEGVETAAEHAMLAQLGCDHVQGYAVARPMALDDTPDWLRRHAARVGHGPVLRRGF